MGNKLYTPDDELANLSRLDLSKVAIAHGMDPRANIRTSSAAMVDLIIAARQRNPAWAEMQKKMPRPVVIDITRYTAQPAEGTTCPGCGEPAVLLSPRDFTRDLPSFYLCPHGFVGQVGHKQLTPCGRDVCIICGGDLDEGICTSRHGDPKP